jgi:hypothetical protein
VATRLSSCARLGLARLVTTAVVCGAAVLFLPRPCEAAVASDAAEAGATVAADEVEISASQAPLSGGAMTTGAALSDPDPSDEDGDDDDDGDAAPDAPAAAAHASAIHADSGEDTVIVSEITPDPLTPLDGHSLRGPPRLSDEDSCDDSDDDDDDDSSECSRSRAITRELQPLHLFVSHTEPARRHVHDGPQLRAP